MQLSDLKETWDELNRTEKLKIIDLSNERRKTAFEKRKQKKSKKRSKSKRKTKKSKRKSKPKTPEDLLEMKKKMSKQEWENFKMMVNTGQI